MTTETEEVEWDDVGFVLASKYRKGVVSHLGERSAQPSGVAEETGHPISNVSGEIRNLRDRGLVELLVPEERRKGRIYGLTDDGERVLEAMQDL